MRQKIDLKKEEKQCCEVDPFSGSAPAPGVKVETNLDCLEPQNNPQVLVNLCTQNLLNSAE